MNDSEQIEEKLYQAATHWLVSERADTDAWKLMGVACGDCRSADDVKVLLAVIEKRIKADFKLSTMPVRWRSAKSTILAAMKAGVPIIDPLGLPKPKTALSKQTKDCTVVDAPAPTASRAFDVAFHDMKLAYTKLSRSEQLTATLGVLAWLTPPRSLVKSPPSIIVKGP